MNSRRNRLLSLLLTLIILSLSCNLTIAVVLPIPRALALHPAAADLPATTTNNANANGIPDVTTKTFTSSPFSRTLTTTPIINSEVDLEASFVKVAAVASSGRSTTITPISITNLIARDGSSTATSTSTSSSSTPTSDSQSGSINVQVWAPLVGIVAVIALLVLYTCFRKNTMNASMIAATRSANEAAANGGSSSSTGPTTRRRPRRTPSQVSTRSLPAYMMDPGEQEIVLARGGMRRNRSRPDMGDEEMYDDDEYDEEDMDNDNDYVPNGRVSQADRPLLNASPGPGLAAPASRHARRSTFDTIQMGSEDSHRGLLRDADEMNDERADGGGGMTYMFGDATTGGQLQVYDEHERGEQEHVEMSQLGGGVSVGSGSGSSNGGGGSASRQRSATSATGQASGFSPPVSPTRHAPSNSNGVSGFFSSFSTLLTNSFTSIAHSLSGMNAPMSGSTIGVGVAGGGGNGGAYSSMADQQQRAMSPPRTTTTTTRTEGGRRNRRQNTGGTAGSTSTTSALLAPSALVQPPPPYEGGNAAHSRSRSSADTAAGMGRSRSRSSPRPSFSTTAPNTNTSSSTLSLPHHIRTVSSPNMPNANASAAGSSTSLTISAPLAHTVTRSAFQYPASGPTTEQIKFLSSREALGKFGMPYGEEAVAAAQAASRDGSGSGSGTGAQEPPPPSFEDVTAAGSGSGSGVGAAATLSGGGQIASSPTSTLSSNLASVPGTTTSATTSTSATTPARSDSVASRISIRSNRNVVTGPRGPRNSLRKSTLTQTQTQSNVEREGAPRPSMDSMDSVDTVDSFGIEMRGKRRDTRDSGGDNGYWDDASGLETQAREQQQQQQQQQQPETQQQRRLTLPKLTLEPVSPISPIIVFSDDTSSANPASATSTSPKPTRSQQKPQIIPKTAPKGFVMSSPPPSPTPTTSTHTHARTVSHADSAELGVPFITFAPATPSAEGDSMIEHEYSHGFP